MDKVISCEFDDFHQDYLDFIKKALKSDNTSEAMRFCLRFTVLNLYRFKNGEW